MAMEEQFTKVGDGLLVRAPGKINLSLLIKGKREDGYHDIETIMAKVDWCDEIVIEKVTRDSCLVTRSSDEPRATSDGATIELICKGEYKVPEGEENLVYKAAKEILNIKNQSPLKTCGDRQVKREEDLGGQENDQYQTPNVECQSEEQKTGGIRITLTKNVPGGAGLGSGSSDAAATLLGVNKFLKLGLGKKEIWELGTKLGSDVAFFLGGPMALCTGKGEKVKKLAECEFRVLLIIPDVSVSTKRVYENYRDREGQYRRLSEEIKIYIEKKRVDLICKLCANMLQESCFELHPELGVLKKKIESLGIRPVCLSGSGSSMFCIVDGSNEEGVMAYQKKLADNGIRSIIVKNNTW